MTSRFFYTTMLAVFLLLQATAYWAFLQFKEASVERRVAVQLEAGVEDGQAYVLRIPKSWEEGYHPHFQRVERGEIRYYGRMYDIFRIEDRGDTTLYHGIFDQEETELFAAASRDLGLGKTGNSIGLPLVLSLCPAVLNARCLPPVIAPDFIFSTPSFSFFLPSHQWGQGPPNPPPERPIWLPLWTLTISYIFPDL